MLRLGSEVGWMPPAPSPGVRPERALLEQVARAVGVQRSLLPDVSVPVGEFRLASLYWPCETLGGDFYDHIWRQDCAMLLVAEAVESSHGRHFADNINLISVSRRGNGCVPTRDASSRVFERHDGIGQ